MIYLRFQTQNAARYGVLEEKTVYEITPNFYGSFKKTGKKYPLEKVKLLAPCQPSKIIALGLNYLGHVNEMGMSIPLQPVIFLKAPTAVVGPEENIIYPSSSRRVDFEAELAVVIKKKGKNITPQKAMDYVLGYTCLNDVTARDLQKLDGQWARSKSFDTFAPIGPYIVDDIDPNNLKIETYLNGRRKQNSNTNDLIFKIDELVSFSSQVMTLLPGDIISTGTPPGVNSMSTGDHIEIKIQHIGTLGNRVI